MRTTNVLRRLGLASLVLVLTGCATTKPPTAPAKIKVARLDDLPKHTYPYHGQVAELIRSEPDVKALAAKVRADTQDVLDRYEIDDASTLQRLYGWLLTCDLIEHRFDDAARHVELIRGLETKEATRLTTGLSTLAVVDARKSANPDADFAAFEAAYRASLEKRVAALPWAVVQDTIRQNKGRLEIMSENLLLGIVSAQMQPAVDKTGELNEDTAASVLAFHQLLVEGLKLKPTTLAVYSKAIEANRVEKPDIWAARSVTFKGSEGYNPVLMAAWDSGTDAQVFTQQLWSNPKEREDGADDDGNGYVDDVHGIAYDIHAQRTTGTLCPLEGAAPRMPQVMQYLKGFMDLQAAIDSPEAAALKKHISELAPNAVQGFIEDLGLAGNYAHGTHVAGLMLAGNPYARLLIARLSYDYHSIPVARTAEWGQRDGQKCRDTVEYFKQTGVRVVNMSWGEALNDAEDSLEKNGIGANADERRTIARQVFKLQHDGLYDAIKNAPDVLFICAAGNADNDVEFDADIPSSFDLPNLLVVGAVDQAGEPTSFTSFGSTVQVYADGFEVESYVPGGQRMKMSGTSMASPNAANLAGKLVAMDPKLTPAEVIGLIKSGADAKTAGARKFLLLNPQRSVELLRTQLAKVE